mgnify:CR=1 FL=1
MQQIQLTETQNKVVEEFAQLNPRRAVIELPTATGKTIIALEILKKYNYQKVLILANTLQLVNQWRSDLVANGVVRFDIITYQSAYKYKDFEFDMLICDEGHHLWSEKWFKLLENNNFKDILILTAVLPRDDMRHLLANKFNIKLISNKSYEIGIKEKLISDFKIFNIGVNLTENEQIQLGKINNFISQNYKHFNFNLQEVKHYSTQKSYIVKNHLASELLLCFQKRKEILNNAVNKLGEVGKILLEEYYNKAIIYCEYINFANSLFEYLKKLELDVCIYHSEIQNKEQVLQNFKDNQNKIIISVKCLDEGLNIPDLDSAIIVSSSSQERQTIQRIGRILRYKEGKTAKVYNLYVKNSREQQWLQERLKSFDKEKIFWR